MEILNGFQMPKKVVQLSVNEEGTYGKYEAQPFERGFGTTIGHALRRTLLSSIEGAAITAVRIEGVPHEFMSIPGIVEDVTDIILNIKKIPLKMHGYAPRMIRINKSGPGDVTSADIETDANVEILDKNIHIATLDKGVTLNMEMRVKVNRGFVPAEFNHDDDLPIGFIPVDSSHSPIKKVHYEVLPARVGRRTDYDKLVMEVFTNGSIHPEDAIAYAAKLLKDQFSLFINFEELEEEVEETPIQDEKENELLEKLNTSIDELELSVRAYNCLKNANIKTIGELVQKSESEVLKIKNFGKITLSELKKVLEGMGLTFGMDVKDLLEKNK